MKTVVLIPARYASTRYPGKPLATLRQKDGSEKSLIQMSYEAASQINGVSDVYVVTDDTRIRRGLRGLWRKGDNDKPRARKRNGACR